MNSEFAHVLNYVAHEDFITQTGKKSKPAPVNFMGPGPGARGPRPKKTNTLIS